MAEPLPIREPMEALFKAVQRNSDAEDDDEFFQCVAAALNDVCKAIAQELNADSCAAYFVDKDLAPERDQRLVMRGACGRLKETLDAASGSVPGRTVTDGAVYKSFISDTLRRSPALPGLTHIVWHCGLARWANSRAQMERLREGSRGGRGEPFAYPGQTLYTVFRNCVIVPIFAPGRVSAALAKKNIQNLVRQAGGFALRPGELRDHWRFLRNHRVVGVLKVENKQPRINAVEAFKARPSFWEGLPFFSRPCPARQGEYPCCGGNECEVEFVERLRADIRDARIKPEDVDRSFTDEERGLQVAWGSHNPRQGGRRISGWCNVCRELVDYCTLGFGATFSNQDVELLVALAMQVGRILPWRTIQYASASKVVLDESEVASLLIGWKDVDDLLALHRASGRAAERLRFLLERLKSDLAFEEQRKVSAAKKWGVLEAREPIRDVKHRPKEYGRLLRKAILRHDALWEDVQNSEPQDARKLFTHRGLVCRLLGPTERRMYNIRDTAGVRLTCDYLSDVERVVGSICSQWRKWHISIREEQDMILRPDPSGYRAMHLDLLVNVSDLLPSADLARLTKLLKDLPEFVKSGDDGTTQVWLPCELQIRTAYEDSWARKSHDLVYKRNRPAAKLPKALMDSLQILANNLYEADRLSDIVREQIEEYLSPELGDEFHVTGLLGERLARLPHDAAIRRLPAGPTTWPFRYMTFAMECARQLYRHNVRYDGQAHYKHALSIALQLVRRFGLFQDENKDQVSRPPSMRRCVTLFALAMLHDCWLAATNAEGAITGPERTEYWDKACLPAFWKLLEDRCSEVIGVYRGSIRCGELFGRSEREWVEAFLNEYRLFWRGELGDVKRRLDPAEKFWKSISGKRLRPEVLADICRLRAAMLIDRLEELPDTPNRERRRERFSGAYTEFRRIREELTSAPGGSVIIGECYRVMRDVAVCLGVEIPIHWYE